MNEFTKIYRLWDGRNTYYRICLGHSSIYLSELPGRNDPCPCNGGGGKTKFKKCEHPLAEGRIDEAGWKQIDERLAQIEAEEATEAAAIAKPPPKLRLLSANSRSSSLVAALLATTINLNIDRRNQP